MLRSPRIITDNVGKVIARKDFNAFGDETASAQRTDTLGYKPEEVRQDYTGYQKDDESGLEFAQARYYNNKHGRFTSVDPLTASANVKDPQTFNRYSYAMNSPYKFTDPLGLVSKPRQSSLVDAGAIASDARNAPAAGTDPIVTGGRANSTPASVQAAEPPPPTVASTDLTDAEIRAQYPVFNAADQAVVNQAITDARNIVDPAGGRNITPSALTGAFRNAGDTTTPQQAMANVDATSGTAVTRNAEGQIETPIKQNVFDGRTSTFMVDPDGDPSTTAKITVAEFSRQNPNVNAITVGENIFVYQGFFNQDAQGRAKSVIHEAVVHKGFGRSDTNFGATQTEGSHAINASIDRAYRFYRSRPIQPIE